MEEKEKNDLQQEEIAKNQNEVIEEVTDSEADADTMEVETDENTEVDEYAHESKDLPDYEHMSIEQLVTEAEKIAEETEVQHFKEEMETLYNVATNHFEEERSVKLHEFVENGGAEMDFFWDQPLRRKLQDAYKKYKAKRHDYYKKLERQLAANLDVKKEIIEAIKDLPNQPGSVPEKYKVFRDFQDRWKDTGPVPRAESDELWKNYHHHVDNFYDFLRISNELRELDFKKNLELKTALCEEAETLAEKDSNPNTFKALQELHAKWKQVGPVDREHREPMWERFSAATKSIHDKRHQYYEELRGKRSELLQQKKEIIEKMAQLELSKLKTHSAWQAIIKEANQLRDAFKKIGRINLPENDELWNKFREINRNFNQEKNAFYKSLKSKHQENLKLKKDLLEKAEELKNSSEWKDAANQLKRIQSEWKKIGYVPKNESDKIWKQFREACNHFFNRLSEHNKEIDQAFENNLKAKQEILEKLKAWSPEGEKSAGKKEIKKFIDEWKEAGRVPRHAKDIENEFNNLLDQHFTALKINKKESALMRFENKMHALAEGENDRQLDREADQIQRQIDDAKKELNQLENNIQFFAHADENSPIVKNAMKSITRQKEQIELLEEKKRLLRKITND